MARGYNLFGPLSGRRIAPHTSASLSFNTQVVYPIPKPAGALTCWLCSAHDML